MDNPKIFTMPFGSIYPLYLKKAEKKGHTKQEVDEIITWLTGYDTGSLQQQLDNTVTIAEFFANAPHPNPKASAITDVICGYRVESIEDPLMQSIRRLDKLIDELAKGKTMENILRK